MKKLLTSFALGLLMPAAAQAGFFGGTTVRSSGTYSADQTFLAEVTIGTTTAGYRAHLAIISSATYFNDLNVGTTFFIRNANVWVRGVPFSVLQASASFYGTGDYAVITGSGVHVASGTLIVSGTGGGVQLPDESINASELEAGAVTTGKLASGAVTTPKIANDAVVAAAIMNTSVTTAKIGDGSVTTIKIANDAVVAAAIMNTSVTTAKIGDGAVVTAKIGNDAVIEARVMSGAVTTAKIGDGAVVTSKVSPDAITEGRVISAAITTTKIGDGAVVTSKIGVAAVTPSKIEKAGNFEFLGNTTLGDAAGDTTNVQGTLIVQRSTVSFLDGTLSVGTTFQVKDAQAWTNGVPFTVNLGTVTFSGEAAADPDFLYEGAVGARVVSRAAQSIGAGGTVSANACGGVKDITSDGDVTTSLSNTFSTPGVGNNGCIMHVCNRGSFNITLDSNGNFVSDADVVLTPNDCVDVESNGSTWIENAASALLDGVVTTGKIASGAVTSAKIINGGVTTDKIGDGAITTAKIGVAAVTTSKLNGGDGGATIDFGALAANTCTDSGTTISVPGARQGNPVDIGATDNLASITGLILTGRVSSNDTVTVRACCVTVGACSVDAPAAQVNVRVAFQ